MIKPGLVSITFRKLAPQDVIRLALEAQLCGIEWGGDVHVPHGDFDRARQVGRMTREAGLEVAAYGSYYRIDNESELPFEKVLETAACLEAPVIRVWAGTRPSESADDAYQRKITLESSRIAEAAAKAGVAVAYEFHRNTLTDTNKSALRLLKGVDHPNMKIYWQPPHNAPAEYCLEGLKAVLPKLAHLHVFNWRLDADGQTERQPLGEAEERWTRYLATVKAAGTDHFAMLEFVREDRPENLMEDSKILNHWLA